MERKPILAAVIAVLLFAPQVSSNDDNGGSGLSYYPVDQCRVLDTRVKTKVWCTDFDFDGKWDDWECLDGVPKNGMLAFVLAGDSTRIVLKNRGYVEKETNIGDQGAAPDGCGIPIDAKVVNVMMAVVPNWKDSPGHVKVWRFEVDHYSAWGGTPVPVRAPENTSALNFSPGETAESTWFLQEICDPNVTNFGDCNEDILIKAVGSPVHVVIDVNGYFK